MIAVAVDPTLWRSSILPEGIVERWFVNNGSLVVLGNKLAEISVEGSRHEIVAPCNGVLLIRAKANTVIEPGSILGELS